MALTPTTQPKGPSVEVAEPEMSQAALQRQPGTPEARFQAGLRAPLQGDAGQLQCRRRAGLTTNLIVTGHCPQAGRAPAESPRESRVSLPLRHCRNGRGARQLS